MNRRSESELRTLNKLYIRTNTSGVLWIVWHTNEYTHTYDKPKPYQTVTLRLNSRFQQKAYFAERYTGDECGGYTQWKDRDRMPEKEHVKEENDKSITFLYSSD